jgi:TolB-like protein
MSGELPAKRPPGVNHNTPLGVPAEAVTGAVQRVLASPSFANSVRLRRFLSFVVEKSIAGEADKLKEYWLGFEVFERGAAFDTRTDSVVRVEAGRLRVKLAKYYAEEGAEDPIVITLPKGTYTPTFTHRPVPSPSNSQPVAQYTPTRKRRAAAWAAGIIVIAAGHVAWRGRPATTESGPVVAVLPFLNLGTDAETDYFAHGLTDDLTAALAKVPHLRLMASASALQLRLRREEWPELTRKLQVAWAIEGSVRRSGQKLRVTAQLVSVADGYSVWSDTYDREATDLFGVQDEIVRDITEAMRVRLRTPGDRPQPGFPRRDTT